MSNSKEIPLPGKKGGKAKRSKQTSLAGRVVTISRTPFAVTALTFESSRSAILRTTYSKPVYVHHVILCPLDIATITNVSTGRYSIPPYLVRISSFPSGAPCYLSVTSVPFLKMDQFLSEVKYRRKYGIIGELHWRLIREKKMPSLIRFNLLFEKPFHTWTPLVLPVYRFTLPSTADLTQIEEQASKDYVMNLMENLMTMIQYHDPIFIE